MPASTTTVPVNFNIYLPKTTYNPYIRNAVSYAQLVDSDSNTSPLLTPGTGMSLTDGSSNNYTWTDVPGDTTAMSFKQLSGNLTYGTEHLVFTAQFKAIADGTQAYAFNSGGNTLIKKRIFTSYPKNAPIHKDFVKDNEESVDVNYANRWRFVEEASNRDSNQLARTVTLKAYYTTPDYRATDVLQTDGTVLTNALEMQKLRGILLVPMLRKSTAIISNKIFDVIVNLAKQNDGVEDQHVAPTKNNSYTPVTAVGKPGATATLRMQQQTGNDLNLRKDFTVPSSGVYRTSIPTPRISANDTYKLFVDARGSTTLDTNVPTETSPKIIYKYLDIDVTIAASQVGSTLSLDAATNIVTGPAFSDYKIGRNVAISTASGDPTSYHKTLATEETRLGGSWFVFKIIVEPTSSKVQIVSSIGATEGYAHNSFVEEIGGLNYATNGGTIADVRYLYLVENGNNVDMYGYVVITQLGSKDTAITIPVNNLMANS